MELEALKLRLSREYDTLMAGLQSELLKLQRQHQQTKDKSVRVFSYNVMLCKTHALCRNKVCLEQIFD